MVLVGVRVCNTNFVWSEREPFRLAIREKKKVFLEQKYGKTSVLDLQIFYFAYMAMRPTRATAISQKNRRSRQKENDTNIG